MSGENTNPKGFNNENDWEKIENSTAPKTTVINIEDNILDDNENPDELIIEELESEEIFRESDQNTDDFSEVLELTQFNETSIVTSNSNYVIAEYQDIKTVDVAKKHEITAKNFVGKITKFVLDFNDVSLTDEHKNYIKQVGKLQLSHLSDLLYLVDVNKQMLNNIIARVNATQAEDYAIINTYNNLANQHLKLIKELSNTYKAIPTTLKKMKADVLSNQELEENPIDDEVITENYGETQFNNSKHMMRSILEERERKKQDEVKS